MKIPLRNVLALLFLVMLAGPAKAGADLAAFTSDGCSLFPDGTVQEGQKWCDCCLQHDMAYWRGGTEEERLKADEALRDCVVEKTRDTALADTMYLAVRAGGHPAFPTWYRWAYGWSYGRAYKPLTDPEKERAHALLDDYRAKHPAGY